LEPVFADFEFAVWPGLLAQDLTQAEEIITDANFIL